MNQRTILLAVASLLLVTGVEKSCAATITISYLNYNKVTSLDTQELAANSVVWFGSWNVETSLVSSALSSYLTGPRLSSDYDTLVSNFTLGRTTTYSDLGAGEIVDFPLSDVGLVGKKIDMLFWNGSTTALATEVAAIRWDSDSYPDVSTLITGVTIANSLPSIGENYVTALFGSFVDTGIFDTETAGRGTIKTTVGLGITSGNPPVGVQGYDYIGYQIAANNEATSFSLDGVLPIGLIFNSTTGLISGKPTQTGPFTFTIGARNDLFANPTFRVVTRIVTLTVNAPDRLPPVITPVGAQTAYRGIPFSLTASANNGPTSFTLSGAPAGFSIGAGGVVAGTTTAQTGTYTLSIRAYGPGGTSDPQLVTLTLANPTITPSQSSVNGAVGSAITPVTFTVVPTGSSPSFVRNSLPAGLTFNFTTGNITGTPTTAGTSTSTVTATFANGVTAQADIVFNILGPRPVLLAPAPAELEATRAQQFSLILQRALNGAVGSPTYEQVDGVDLKTIGLDLQKVANDKVVAGVISGTPTKLGIYSASFRAYNSSGASNILPITITVDAAQPVINCELNRAAGVGSPFRHVFTSNDSEQVKTVTGLPPGLTFQRNVSFNKNFFDMISGVPSSPGSFPVTLSASTQKLNGSTLTASSTLTIQVDGSTPNLSSLGVRPGTFRLNQPTFTTYAPAEGFFLTGSDMGANSTIYMNATGLPPGLGFGKTWNGSAYADGTTTQKTLARRRGLITGTPTQAGVYPITLYVQNGLGYTKSALVLTVLP
jgi:hypothetical protein